MGFERVFLKLYDAEWLETNADRTLRSIAEELGCSRHCVARAYETQGMADLRTRKRGRPVSTPEQASRRAKAVVSARRMGCTFQEIAAELGISHQGASEMFRTWDSRIPREDGQ